MCFTFDEVVGINWVVVVVISLWDLIMAETPKALVSSEASNSFVTPTDNVLVEE